MNIHGGEPQDERPLVLLVDDDPVVRDVLAWVIQSTGHTPLMAAGEEGFRLLTERADRIALVLLEGINDIGLARSNPSPSAADLIAAHKQLIERAHARGLKIYGATLTPYEGAAYATPEGEAKRQALNDWIRTSGAYDGVIDFDKVTRDPAAPTRFLPAYDSGDHLHPGDAGYTAMGNSIDLALFK